MYSENMQQFCCAFILNYFRWAKTNLSCLKPLKYITNTPLSKYQTKSPHPRLFHNAKQNTNGPQKGKEMLFSLSVILLFRKPFCISQQMRFWRALKGLLGGLRKRRVGIPSDSGPKVRVSLMLWNKPAFMCTKRAMWQPKAKSSPMAHGTNIKK